MRELHEIRVYMLLVSMFACLLRIGMVLWPLIEETHQWYAIKETVLRCWNCW